MWGYATPHIFQNGTLTGVIEHDKNLYRIELGKIHKYMKKKKSYYTTIYRIEHPTDGNGPYRSAYISEKLLDEMMEKHSTTISALHPSPGREIPSLYKTWYLGLICGCKNMKQLKEWFGEFIPKLIKEGFRIVKYFIPIDKVIFGKRQVVFDYRAYLYFKTIPYKTRPQKGKTYFSNKK